jgi:hypothetical protein
VISDRPITDRQTARQKGRKTGQKYKKTDKQGRKTERQKIRKLKNSRFIRQSSHNSLFIAS